MCCFLTAYSLRFRSVPLSVIRCHYFTNESVFSRSHHPRMYSMWVCELHMGVLKFAFLRPQLSCIICALLPASPQVLLCSASSFPYLIIKDCSALSKILIPYFSLETWVVLGSDWLCHGDDCLNLLFRFRLWLTSNLSFSPKNGLLFKSLKGNFPFRVQ